MLLLFRPRISIRVMIVSSTGKLGRLSQLGCVVEGLVFGPVVEKEEVSVFVRELVVFFGYWLLRNELRGRRLS